EFHCEQVIQALQRGKPVLVEKPLCATSQELQQIETVCRKCSAPFLMVAENYYYKPIQRRIRTVIGNGGIGEVREVYFQKHKSQRAIHWRQKYGALLEG